MTRRSFVGLAKQYALHHHGDQKYGELPYEVHLQAVVNVLLESCSWNPALEVRLAAAWLHDVVEDTEATQRTVWDEFGPEVAAIVWACSGVGKNRTERNASIYQKIGDLEPEPRRDAAMVKVADRIANLEQAAPGSRHKSMYRRERVAFYNAVARYSSPNLIDRLTAAYGD